MITYLMDVLQEYGYWGLFISTALEASSLPFPGAFFMLFFGFVIEGTAWQMVFISLVNSIVFTIFSLIPYWIGMQIQGYSRKKFDQEKIDKAQKWFKKYGSWSIMLSRPLSIGNYISYIAGLSNINIWSYTIFTFFGIFPWSTFLLFVGSSKDLESIEHFLQQIQEFSWLIISILIVAAAGYGWMVWRKSVQKKKECRSSSQ